MGFMFTLSPAETLGFIVVFFCLGFIAILRLVRFLASRWGFEDIGHAFMALAVLTAFLMGAFVSYAITEALAIDCQPIVG